MTFAFAYGCSVTNDALAAAAWRARSALAAAAFFALSRRPSEQAR